MVRIAHSVSSGELMRPGHGAPWAMLHLGIDRRDDHWKTLQFPHLRRHEADWPAPNTPSIERWLHPDQWANRRRDWHRLPEALDAVSKHLAYLPVRGIGSVAVLFPSIIPRSQEDPLVEFTIRIPRTAARGARIDWSQLVKYGTNSAAQYRAYLSVAAFLDRTAHRGHAITAEIAAPVLHPDGSPKRDKGGRILRSKDETKPNPVTRFMKPVSDADLTRMIGFDPTNRDHRRKARNAFDHLHEDGVIDLRRKGGELYLFGPRKLRS